MEEDDTKEAKEVDEWLCVLIASSCTRGSAGTLIRPAPPLLLLPEVAATLRGLVVLSVVDLPALPSIPRGWGKAIGVVIGVLNAVLDPVTEDGASGARREAAAASLSSAAAAATAVARRWRWGRKTMLVDG